MCGHAWGVWVCESVEVCASLSTMGVIALTAFFVVASASVLCVRMVAARWAHVHLGTRLSELTGVCLKGKRRGSTPCRGPTQAVAADV